MGGWRTERLQGKLVGSLQSQLARHPFLESRRGVLLPSAEPLGDFRHRRLKTSAKGCLESLAGVWKLLELSHGGIEIRDVWQAPPYPRGCREGCLRDAERPLKLLGSWSELTGQGLRGGLIRSCRCANTGYAVRRSEAVLCLRIAPCYYTTRDASCAGSSKSQSTPHPKTTVLQRKWVDGNTANHIP